MQQYPTSQTLKVDNMTCASCESRIVKALKRLEGVQKASASYNTGNVNVVYDKQKVSLTRLEEAIENLGYTVARPGASAGGLKKLPQAVGLGVLLLALYMLLNHFGFLDYFNMFPEAEAGMGYGMLFVIGLMTSVHCVAMCGGINLSQCVPVSAQGAGDKGANLRPSLLYNLGRVISYTLIGGIVGAIGQVVSFSGGAKGVVQLAAGVFMVIMGLNMLNLFPWLRRLNPRMPKLFARRISGEKARSNSPLYVGLLNGLMPCGPLQAMQLYALSTGSPVQGALSMLLFSLGTVPLMFGLGALSSLLSKRFMGRMMTVSAVLVVLMGAVMFTNGMSLSGMAAPSLTQTPQVVQPDIQMEAGVQAITTQLARNRYEPITVKVGVPVKWTIHAEPGTVNGCNNRIIIPAYDSLEKKLEVGDNVIEFTPAETGVFPFSCWMGMIRSTITVVE